MSELTDAITRQRAALLAGDNATRLAMTRQWLALESALLPQIDALTLELSQLPSPLYTPRQLSKLKRYQALLDQIEAELSRYLPNVAEGITARQQEMIALAQDHATELLAVQGIAGGFDRLPVAAIQNMTGALADGSPLLATLRDAAGIGAPALGQELVNGIALGLGPRDMARRALRRGLGQSFLRTALIARTEVARSYRGASLDAYRRSDNVVQYMRVASKSSRTCISCLALDGTIYDLATDFEQHPACRCTLIPVLRNRPAPTFQTGRQWFEQQDEATQREMMGAPRWRLWQTGRAGWDDLVRINVDPVWGNSPGLTPVSALGGGT